MIYDTWALTSGRNEISEILGHTVAIGKSVKNTIFYAWRLNSRRYQISEILARTVVISGKLVKSAKNKICDTWALNSRRYEIAEFLGHTTGTKPFSLNCLIRNFIPSEFQ